ncbi:MAG: hypothetical protein WCG02_00560 [Candidatus Taylorbacteria bacterium]
MLDPVNINLINHFFDGSLRFGDLWATYNGANIFGGLIITLANIVFFGLNTRFEMILSLVFMGITSVVLFEYVRKLFLPIASRKLIQLLFSIILLIVFSLNQWENIVFSGGAIQIIGLLPFILVMLFFDTIIRKSLGRNDILYYLVIVLLSVIFGCQYAFGLIAAIIVSVVIKKVFDRADKLHSYNMIFAILANVTIYIVFYYSVFNNNVANGGVILSSFMNNTVESLKFIFLTFCGTSVGVDLYNYSNIGIVGGVVIGIIVVSIYLYAIFLYFKSQLSKQTIVPLLMIIYSIITVGMIFISRFNFGIAYGLSSRYTTSTMLGIIGCIIIFLYSIFNRHSTSKVKMYSVTNLLILMSLLFVILSQALTIRQEWLISPYRKEAYNKMRLMALDIDAYSNDDMVLFQAKNSQYVIDTIATLKKYKLSVFREDIPVEKIMKLSGWNSDGWISRNARMRIMSGQQGILSMSIYVPPDIFLKDYKSSFLLIISNGGKLLVEHSYNKGSFDGGPVTISINIPRNELLNIELILNKSFVPAKVNDSKDMRELGVLIDNIKVY